MMKQVKYWSLGILISSFGSLCANSHSFFRPRSITMDPTYELAMSNYFFYRNYIYNHDEQATGFAFFATPFYQRSTNRNNPGRYFLPGNNCSIRVAENGGDVNSLWLGLVAPVGEQFSSQISLKPRREVYGAYLHGYFDLSYFWEHTWLSVATAAIGVKHTTGLRECNSSNNGTVVAQGVPISNVSRALNNPDWKFGKFSPCPRKKGGIDDVQIKLGHGWLYGQDCMNHFDIYVVAIAPTGRHTTGEYLFEPIVGGRNGGIGAGFNADYTCYETECAQILLMTDFKYCYLFGADECRSFDLCPNGDWSRYMQVVPRSNPVASTAGINYFSQRVNVVPRRTINWWAAAHYASDSCFHGEIGYTFWYRQEEHISCLKPLPSPVLAQQFGILDLGGLCGVATTASDANITQSMAQVVSDTSFVAVTANNLKKESAAHPRAISHKLYGTVGYEVPEDYTTVACIASLGGSYEFAQSYTALDSWALWVKLGFLF